MYCCNLHMMQLQTSLVEARQQLEDLQQQHRQQQRQCEDTGKHLAVLQTQRTAAAAEAAGAQQELSRVLKELEQCQRVGHTLTENLRSLGNISECTAAAEAAQYASPALLAWCLFACRR